MRKALTITLVAALALFAGSAAYANYCARDVVPASTILVPYVVNDMLDNYTPDDQGYTTFLTITNVSREAQIIHITVWNAVSTACLDFNEVLTGYDMWQINFRDMIAGDFDKFDTSRDSTAYPNNDYPAQKLQRQPFEWGPDGRSAYAPPTEAGLPLPEKTTILSGEDCQMPYGKVGVRTNVDCLRAPLTARTHYGCLHVANNLVTRGGQFNVRTKFVGTDWLSKLGTDPLFYYVTVDVVNTCNFLFPNDNTYFSEFYVNENVLIGDIVYVSSATKYSEAINAVHIESDFGTSQIFNFYDEKVNNPADEAELYLEPLATALAFDYYNGKDGVTSSVMLWKNYTEFKDNGQVDDCGAYLYYAWDQDEHVITRQGSCQVSPCSVNDIDPNEFPFETQKVPITNDNFDLPANAGWMLVIFPPSYGYPIDRDPTAPTGNPLFTRQYMAWAAVQINYGAYSAGIEAATLANAHCFSRQVQPQLGVNYDTYPVAE